MCFCPRWEEEKTADGVKWTQLEHRGPYFAPLYEPLPDDVQFYYDGKPTLGGGVCCSPLHSQGDDYAPLYIRGDNAGHELLNAEIL